MQVPADGKIEKEENLEQISIADACLNILFGKHFADKVCLYRNVIWDQKICTLDLSNIVPGRPPSLQFATARVKFPKDAEFSHSLKRAQALHFFANHELLAVEIMCLMILKLKWDTPELEHVKRTIWTTLQDEQRHLHMYQRRLVELGFTFGDFPVNDFFWRSFLKVEKLEDYMSLMSLTFETANLDFAAFYSSLFEKNGDFASAQLMQKIYLDELHHVGVGIKYFETTYPTQSLWESYKKYQPYPITPARSKGIHYQRHHRSLAGFSTQFIEQLEDFTDNFRITDRKR